MGWSFLFSALGAFLTPHAQPLLEGAVEKAGGARLAQDAPSLRVVTFVFMLSLPALATWAVGGDSSAFAALLGGLIGLFAPQIYAYLRDPHRADVPADEQWDGRLQEGRVVRRPLARTAGEEEGETTPAPKTDEATLRAVADAVRPPDPVDAPQPVAQATGPQPQEGLRP